MATKCIKHLEEQMQAFIPIRIKKSMYMGIFDVLIVILKIPHFHYSESFWGSLEII